MKKNGISRKLLTDRVDVVGRRQRVSGQEVSVSEEHTVAANVRTLIVTSSAASISTVFGMSLGAGVFAFFNATPVVRKNDRLVERKSGTAYVVDVVERHPSPHRFNIQVATLTVDLDAGVAG